MLDLRPTCEHCNKPLPPASTEAMICSFECTFCRDCVEQLYNVCPNCGGGFTARPIRPVNEWRSGAFLGKHPATRTMTHKPIDLVAHASFASSLKGVAPEDR
ncbi:DUF1272 domain-containing protein [Dyella subtropica]|uniref:DUF1272 domain-containing protein n=1 Tax=Dyella subtropica TaxID=2992127 RepID=UPI00225BFE56|nr:DUF1272 domain-containing protein [Dyella subtropica]